MAAHLYWQINVTENDGSSTTVGIAEVEMRATAGGADQCSGGTASASTTDGSSVASHAFDNDAATQWYAGNTITTGWLRYQFASAVDVAQYTIQATTTPIRSPRTWTLEYSDDGVAWTPIESRDAQTGWTSGEIRTFTVPTTLPNTRVSQVAVEVLRTNTAVKARVSQLPIEVLRTNTGVKARASQLAVEVLRPNADPVASGARPVVVVIT